MLLNNGPIYRWFEYWELQDEEVKTAFEASYKGLKALTPLYRFAYCFQSYLLEILSLCLIKKTRSIKKLSNDDYEKLLSWMFLNKRPLIRSLGVLYCYPLLEPISATHLDEKLFQTEHPLKHEKSEIYKNPDGSKVYDVIVIGSGAGGAPLAWKLSKDGYKVALIEKGDIVHPKKFSGLLRENFMQHGLLASFSANTMPVLAGANIGGSTPINMGTFMRPSAETLSVLDEKFGTSYTGEEFSKLMDIVEEISSTREPLDSELSSSSKMFSEGLKKLGLEGAFKLNHSFRKTNEQVYENIQYPYLALNSVDRCFIPEAINNGLDFFACTEAVKVQESGDVVEVQVKKREAFHIIKAKKLIISAGTLLTPKLIQKNKLGSNWMEAGKHLKLHPSISVYAHFDNFRQGYGLPQDLGLRLNEFDGITFEGIRVPKELGLVAFIAGSKDFKWWFNHYDETATFGALLKDTTEGEVKYIKNNIVIKYLMNQSDVLSLGRASVFIAKAFLAAGATKALLPISSSQSEVGSIEELESLDIEKLFTPANLNSAAFHPTGTAGLGRVVDRDFKIIGTHNIYVSDASVIPLALGVNPQLFIMANALHIASLIENRLKSEGSYKI